MMAKKFVGEIGTVAGAGGITGYIHLPVDRFPGAYMQMLPKVGWHRGETDASVRCDTLDSV